MRPAEISLPEAINSFSRDKIERRKSARDRDQECCNSRLSYSVPCHTITLVFLGGDTDSCFNQA